MMTRRLGLAAVAAVLLSSCAAQRDVASHSPATSPKQTSAPQRTDGPSVRFIRPASGALLGSRAVELAIAVERFEVVAKQFQPPVEGEGHVHFYLDVDDLPTTHARPTTGEYRSVSRTTYAWAAVPAGEHTFAVQLVGNDHVPLDPPAKDEVKINVR